MLINTMELVFHRAPGKRLPQSDSPPPLHQLRPHLHHLPSAQAFAVDGAEGLGHQAFDVLAHRSEEHTSELQPPCNLVCRLLLEKKEKTARLHPPGQFP